MVFVLAFEKSKPKTKRTKTKYYKMDFIHENLLTILILLPAFGAIAVIGHSTFLEARQPSKMGYIRDNRCKFFGFACFGFCKSDISKGGFYFEKNTPWISAINTNYHIGVDGLSLWLVVLTTFIMPIAVLSTWDSVTKRLTTFYAFMLLVESAMIGVFVSLDLLVFYLFFEASLVPMFFLIGIWGGENRIYAAVKFFIFTALGSLLMLVAIIALYYLHFQQVGFGTFDYLILA